MDTKTRVRSPLIYLPHLYISYQAGRHSSISLRSLIPDSHILHPDTNLCSWLQRTLHLHFTTFWSQRHCTGTRYQDVGSIRNFRSSRPIRKYHCQCRIRAYWSSCGFKLRRSMVYICPGRIEKVDDEPGCSLDAPDVWEKCHDKYGKLGFFC